MIFRTKVLGGGGYNVAENDSITPQNNREYCQKLQQTSIFSKNEKNLKTAKTYKNNKNECYKIESKHFFRTTLIVWFFLVCISLSFLIFQPNCFQNKNVFAMAGSACYFDVLIDLGYKETELSGLDTFLNDSSKNIIPCRGSYSYVNTGTRTLPDYSLTKFEGKIQGNIDYTGNYNSNNATIMIDAPVWGMDFDVKQIEYSNIKLTSLDLTPLANYLSSLDMPEEFGGFEIVTPTNGNVTISGNIVSSGDEKLSEVIFVNTTSGAGYGLYDTSFGFILKAVWSKKVTTSNTTITSTVTGVNNSAVFVYIMSESGTTSQYALIGNDSIVLTQNIGDTITILVSKPYMWSMTVSGDCTQDSANKYKISYAVTNVNKNITLTFSGGAASSVIVI